MSLSKRNIEAEYNLTISFCSRPSRCYCATHLSGFLTSSFSRSLLVLHSLVLVEQELFRRIYRSMNVLGLNILRSSPYTGCLIYFVLCIHLGLLVSNLLFQDLYLFNLFINLHLLVLIHTLKFCYLLF